MILHIREADVPEHEALASLYRSWAYAGGIAPHDRVLVATCDDIIVGLVRECNEGGTTLLRGLWVDPSRQRQGVGQQLLAAFVDRLQNRECFCLPFTHLVPFYQRAQFRLVTDDELPRFLAHRLATYRADARSIVAMRRTREPIRAPIAG